MQSKISRSDIINIMIDAVMQGADIIFDHEFDLDQELVINEKESGEPVTDLDLLVEESLVRILSLARPSYGFFTEELYSMDDVSKFDYRWIIDPIDGTFNFMRGNPNFGLSIALEHVNPEYNRKIIASVIFLPMFDQLYWAEKGYGAFCISGGNEKRIYFSNRTNWRDLLLGSGESLTQNKKTIMDLINNKSLQVRITGSAAVDFTFVASGKFDVLTQDSLKPWDIAPGMLLCREAGGKVVNTKGNDASIYDSDIIVINSVLLDLLKSKLK